MAAAVIVPSAADPGEVFQRLYQTAHWEGGSGQGSRAAGTEAYRHAVERMLGAPDVRVVVDVGCGDWEFAQLVDWSTVTYTGLDVVPAVIAENRQRFGAPGIRFDCADITRASLPRGDLLLCKDVLQHWPIGLMRDFLRRVRNRYRYVMLTNDIASVHCPSDSLNAEIPLGAWRIVDLERAPFDVHADWRHDYDIRGEWTKRMLLLVSRRYRLKALLSPNSALNRLRQSIDDEKMQH